MKNKIIFFLIFISSILSINAQTITFTEGPELERAIGSGKDFTIAEDENSFYIIRSAFQGTLYLKKWIEKFNKKTLSIEYSTDIEITEKGKEFFGYDYNSSKFELKNGEILIFYDIYNYKKKKKILYQKSIDKNGIPSERRELASIECTPYTIQSFAYSCILTKDKSKLLVQLSRLVNSIPTQTISFYDYPSMNIIWSKDSPTDYKGINILANIDSVLNDGTAFVSFETGNQADNDYKTYIASIKSKDSLSFSNVYRPTGYLNETKYRFSSEELISKSGKIIRSGIYYEKAGAFDKTNPPNLKMGTYLSYVDPLNKNVTFEAYGLFPDDVNNKLAYLTDYTGYTKGAFAINKSLMTQEIIELDGDVYVIIENKQDFAAQAVSVQPTHLSFNRELIVSKFNSSGKHEWTKIIPRYTMSSGDYNVIAYNKKLFFFYLENPKNETFDFNNYTGKEYLEKFEPGKLKAANTVCTTIESNGTMSKQIILKPIKDQFYYCPYWKGIKIGNNSLIVHYQFGMSSTSNTKLGLITVK